MKNRGTTQKSSRRLALASLFSQEPQSHWLAYGVGTLRSLLGQHDWAPFLCAILVFLGSLGGLGGSIWPHAISGVLNIWDAASEHRTQVISLFAFTGVVRFILAYVGFRYWTFRGRSAPHDPWEGIDVVARNEILRASDGTGPVRSNRAWQFSRNNAYHRGKSQ